MSVSYYNYSSKKLLPRNPEVLSNTPRDIESNPERPVFSKNDIMKTPFLFIQAHKEDYYNMAQEAMRGVQEETILSKVFFSPQRLRKASLSSWSKYCSLTMLGSLKSPPHIT